MRHRSALVLASRQLPPRYHAHRAAACCGRCGWPHCSLEYFLPYPALPRGAGGGKQVLDRDLLGVECGLRRRGEGVCHHLADCAAIEADTCVRAGGELGRRGQPPDRRIGSAETLRQSERILPQATLSGSGTLRMRSQRDMKAPSTACGKLLVATNSRLLWSSARASSWTSTASVAR